MDHSQAINYLIGSYGYKSYLEIGVSQGVCFEKIVCDKKICVDPYPRYSKTNFVCTSDDFFKCNDIFFDIIFVDGFHEQNQVVRDVENSLKFLNTNGTIVCHDINATENSLPNSIDWSGFGTAWKGWLKLRECRNDLDMKVLEDGEGCGIIRVGNQDTIKINGLSPWDIDWDSKDFWDLFKKNRKKWLNLITSSEFLQLYKGNRP